MNHSTPSPLRRFYHLAKQCYNKKQKLAGDCLYLKVFRILSYIAAAVVLLNVGLRWFADIDLIGSAWFTVLVIILPVALGVESYIDETRGNKIAYFYFLVSGIMFGFLIYEVINNVII